MSEYEILSNIAERDHLDQICYDPHVRTMLERGKNYGLSQIELFELSKLMENNGLGKNAVYHIEYLRNLKS
jgi:hypothetical protein